METIVSTDDGLDHISFEYEGDGYEYVRLLVGDVLVCLPEWDAEAFVLDAINPGSAYRLHSDRCSLHPFVTAIECLACS